VAGARAGAAVAALHAAKPHAVTAVLDVVKPLSFISYKSIYDEL
jgi:hypothetical protein